MSPDPQSLIAEIDVWLKDQTEPELESGHWYALENLKAFASAIQADQSTPSIAKAIWVLGHRLTDQYDWPEEDVKTIGYFLTIARKIEKVSKNG